MIRTSVLNEVLIYCSVNWCFFLLDKVHRKFWMTNMFIIFYNILNTLQYI